MNIVIKQIGNLLAYRGSLKTVDIFPFLIRSEHIQHRPPFVDDVPKTTAYGGRYIVTMIPGVGAGLQMMKHVKEVYQTACAPVDFEDIENLTNAEQILSSIRRNGVAIKGHIPDIAGNCSNVKIRTNLDLFLYRVHCLSYPQVRSRFQNLDIHVFRQNTEGEYAHLEHESKPGIVESLKIITRSNTTRFARWAYDFARENRRKKITIVHKANIMKLTDGLFLKTIEDIGQDYPEIKTENLIVDNACMQMVSKPQSFDVILTPNLYGNIIISIICGLIGGYGLIAGQNYSTTCAVFEVGLRHLAFENEEVVNPIAMLNASVHLLYYLKKKAHGDLISDAIYKTLVKDKIYTPDVGGKNTGCEVVDAVKRNIKDVIGDCSAKKKAKKGPKR